MNRKYLFAAGLFFAATATFAHDGVQNAAVKARMDAMAKIGESTKVLGLMAKGATPFDAAQAQAAALAIATHAAQTPDLFRMQEDDPKSEALPVIWEKLDDFTAKAGALQAVATQYSTSISSLEDVQAALISLGGQCKACHSTYRE